MTTTREMTALLSLVLPEWLTSGCGQGAYNATGLAAPCTHALTASSQAVPSDGGVFSTTIVTTSPRYSWNATSDASWIALAARSGTGTGPLVYIIAANAGSMRRGTITVYWTGGSMQMTVIQDPLQ